MKDNDVPIVKPLASHESLFVNPADILFANRKKEEIMNFLVDNLECLEDEQVCEKLAEAKFYSRYEDVVFQTWWRFRKHDFALNRWEDLEDDQKDKWRIVVRDNIERLSVLIAEVKSK